MPQLSILLLGDTDCAEFRDPRQCLDQWGTVYRFADVAAATAALDGAEVVPDVIVVAQAFPGQFSHQAMEAVRRRAPLARLVGLMGSWCEGEMRSGSPWPGVVRTYWHQWTARSGRELRRLAEGECCSWALPSTATEEERLLAGTTEPWPPREGVVVICTRSSEMADWLRAACRSRGLAAVRQPATAAVRVEGATAAIFDGTSLHDADCEQLRRLAAMVRPGPVVALLMFPARSTTAAPWRRGQRPCSPNRSC